MLQKIAALFQRRASTDVRAAYRIGRRHSRIGTIQAPARADLFAAYERGWLRARRYH